MAHQKVKKTLVYPKSWGLTKKQVLRERSKLYNPDIWDYSRRKSGAHVLKMNMRKADEKLRNGTFKSSYSSGYFSPLDKPFRSKFGSL